MKKNSFTLFFILTFSMLSVLAKDGIGMLRQGIFNEGWKFNLDDDAAFKNPTFDDSGWRNVTLPHDWMIETEMKENNPSGPMGAFLSGGVGWYRKTFELSDSLKAKSITIQFDGIYMNSEVWVNGHFLGLYPYGYSRIQYNLTGLLKFDEKNVIAVRVDNSLEPSSRYYSGAGIYRNVWLITTNTAHFHNAEGVFVTYQNVSEKKATISCKYKVVAGAFEGTEFYWWRQNSTLNKRVKKEMTITSVILDSKGKEVANFSQKDSIQDYTTKEITQAFDISNPKLWSANTPNMYYLKSSLSYDGQIVDEQITPIGIRSIEFTAEKGFLINGKQEKLKGVCLHQDAGSLGTAVPDGVWHYRLSKLKEMGANAIRTSHHPFSPEFYNMCDSMGFYVLDEAFDEWNKGYDLSVERTSGKTAYGNHRFFAQWAETDLRSMIQRDRNHPSVIMYSIGNEIPNQLYADGAVLATKLQNICNDEDSTRKVTAGCDFISYANENGFLAALNIAGYNYLGRYYGGEDLYGVEKQKYPNRLFLGTETYYDSFYWKAVKDNDYVIGEFIWVGFDYLGEGLKWPKRGWDAGLIDMAGAERPEYYKRKSMWSEEPVVHIAVPFAEKRQSEWHPEPVISHWNWEWNANFLTDVYIYSNCDEVELFVNDVSQGKKVVSKDEKVAIWKIPFSPGTIKAIGYNNSKQVAEHMLKTAGEADGLKLNCKKTSLAVNGTDVAIIEIEIIDKNGVSVPTAQNEITIAIEGNATLIGLDSGDQHSHERYKTNSRKAYNGRLLATVQTTNASGEIKISCSAEGLDPTILKINSAR